MRHVLSFSCFRSLSPFHRYFNACQWLSTCGAGSLTCITIACISWLPALLPCILQSKQGRWTTLAIRKTGETRYCLMTGVSKYLIEWAQGSWDSIQSLRGIAVRYVKVCWTSIYIYTTAFFLHRIPNKI